VLIAKVNKAKQRLQIGAEPRVNDTF